jgi:hypothetical protein
VGGALKEIDFFMEPRNRISPGYLEQQRQLHANPNYGIASVGYAPIVQGILLDFELESVSDYGAGKQRLRTALEDLGTPPFDYYPYDPAFPEYGEPQPADLVCCIDVLEHIEAECLDDVLLDLRDITIRAGFFTVHTGPALKVLPDGRNAHLIQKPTSWWLPRLCQHFEIEQLTRGEGGFWVMVTPRAKAR